MEHKVTCLSESVFIQTAQKVWVLFFIIELKVSFEWILLNDIVRGQTAGISTVTLAKQAGKVNFSFRAVKTCWWARAPRDDSTIRCMGHDSTYYLENPATTLESFMPKDKARAWDTIPKAFSVQGHSVSRNLLCRTRTVKSPCMSCSLQWPL